MAEDGEISETEMQELQEQEAEEEALAEQQRKEKERKKKAKEKMTGKVCRTRIEQLAQPNRRLILNLWEQHSYHLPREKVEHIKSLLQELYALTPEEAEKYFEHLAAEERSALCKHQAKAKLIAKLKKQRMEQQRQKAYRRFFCLLKCGMRHAVRHPAPILVSIRLRNLSDTILEQICGMRGVRVPSRDTDDKVGKFLIAVADWMAVALERLYYNVQLKKNLELEQIQADEDDKVEETAPGEKKIPKTTTRSKSEEELKVIGEVQVASVTELDDEPAELEFE